jgi:Carbohydrate esterase, sialic acid-specific acetylesterase
MMRFNFFSLIIPLILFGAVFQAQAITLGGTNVPKDHFIVYLGIGHCNFAGRNSTTADTVTNPHAWNYAWDSQGRSDTQWVLAQEHNGGSSAGNTALGYSGLTQRGVGGPSMPFLKGMVQQYPGYYFGIITNALSCATVRIVTGDTIIGVPLSDIDSYSKSGGGNRYKEIIGLAQKVKNDVTFGGIICMLGLTEVRDGTKAGVGTIKSDFVQMVLDIRGDLGLPNLPFLIGHYEMGATGVFSPTSPLGPIVVKAIDSLPTALAYCDTVSEVGCTLRPNDDHHYSTQGENLWASNAVACIVKHGWFPTVSSVNGGGRNAVKEMPASVSVLSRDVKHVSILVSFQKTVLHPSLALFSANGEEVRGQGSFSSNQIRYDIEGSGRGFYVAKVSGDGITAFKHLLLLP